MTRPILGVPEPVASAVDREALIADLLALVAIPSITGRGGRRRLVASAWCRRADPQPRPDPSEMRADPDWPGEEMPRTSLPLVIGRGGRVGGRRIVLSGHSTSSCPGDLATWTVDLWRAIRDGALYGRGACDMKGGIAAIPAAAVRTLVATGDLDRLDGELVVAFVPSEEDGGQGRAGRDPGFGGDLAITEPSNLDVVVAHAARPCPPTVPGRAAHVAASRGRVGARQAVRAQPARSRRTARRNEAETDLADGARAAPRSRHRPAEWASTVLDRASPTALRRPAGPVGRGREAEPGGDRRGLRRRRLPAHAPGDGRDHRRAVRSARVPSDHPLPVGLAAVIEAETGCRPTLLGEPYGADMQLFVNRRCTPCVIPVRATSGSRTAPTSKCRSTRSRRAPGC